jgi:peptidoglycan hydrolase-like protein with peptidoglycan-binding domain
LPTTDLDRMQQILTARGYYHDKIDGKAGMLTRAALGDYQKKDGLKLDCWPTAAVLQQMGAGVDLSRSSPRKREHQLLARSCRPGRLC